MRRHPFQRSWSLGLMVLIATAAGCTAVGPDYVTPEAAVAAAWMEAGDGRIKGEEADLRYWWRVLNDPVLDDLIAQAYNQNLTLHQVAVRILQSRAVRAIAVGTQYPQAQQLRGGYERVSLSEYAPNQRQADHNFGFYDIGFDVAWEVDFWGKFRRGIEATTAELEAAIAEYDDVVVSLAAEVALAYVEIRTFQRRLDLARANVKIQERSLQIADVRFRNGAVTELDVTQATTLLKETESAIPDFELAIRQLQNGLCVLMGIPPQDLGEMLGTGAIPAAPAEVAIGIPADLLRRRPDIRIAERLAAAQCARIGIAESELYPAFTLFGSIGLETGDNGRNFGTKGRNITDLFQGDSIALALGGSVVWPFFNYGRLKNNVRAQDAAFQQFVLSYQNTVLEAAKEVEDAVAGFLRRQEQSDLLADAVKAASRSVELAEIQYRDGAVDFQRVLDSQRALSLEQDFEAATQGLVIANLIRIYKALGGGWQTQRTPNFIPESIQEEMRVRTDWGDWLPAATPGTSEGEVPPVPGETPETD